MNWDAISAIAEVCGALAVLITFVYLAVQTRDNVKVMRSRAIWELRCGYAQGMLEKPRFKEFWEIDKNNSMFTVDLIKSIERQGQAADVEFMGVSIK
jgi:hypothetical protein